MEIVISYETALERHPEMVAEIIEKLRKGKSKNKDAKPEELKWSYDWCVQVKGYSGEEFLSKLITGELFEEEKEETVEDKLAAVMASLDATIGKWRGGVVLEKIPPEIRALYEEEKAYEIPSELKENPVLTFKNDRWKEKVETKEFPIITGYVSASKNKEEKIPKIVVDDEGVSIIYEIYEEYAEWAGGPHGSFEKKLLEASEGEVIRYRNRPFRKLSLKEIEELTKDKQYTWAHPGFVSHTR